jgi:hypothetical protein
MKATGGSSWDTWRLVFLGSAPPAELTLGWRGLKVFWRELWGASAPESSGGAGSPDRTVGLAPPRPPLPTRAGSRVLSSRRFEKARGRRGRGQEPERRPCSDWPGASARFARLGQGHAHPRDAVPGLDVFAASDFSSYLEPVVCFR